jgi:hypothetical protein
MICTWRYLFIVVSPGSKQVSNSTKVRYGYIRQVPKWTCSKFGAFPEFTKKTTAASGWDGAVNPGLLQLWAPELFDDVPPPEMPLVSAQWLWAALSNDPKTALAEMVAAKSDTWLTGLSWLCFVGHKDIELQR